MDTTVQEGDNRDASQFDLLLPGFSLDPPADSSAPPLEQPIGVDDEATWWEEQEAAVDLDRAHGTYLTTLTSYGAERLSRETARIRTELAATQQQLQELAFRNYKGFVSAARSVRDVNKDVEHISSHLDRVREGLSPLTDTCNDFVKRATTIAQERTKQQMMLKQHGTVLELLEIPQLMDTCVRNGHFEEALELEHFAHRLAKTHGSVSIFRDIHEEVLRSTRDMEQQLLHMLQQDAKLPQFLRALSYLRRLSTRSERDLRVAFLQCRTAWLDSLMDNLPRDHTHTYLARLADIYRVQVFEVITQYKAIFAGDEMDEPVESDVGSPMNEWIIGRITSYLVAVEAMLPQIKTGATLNDLLEQSMHLAFSFGRAGTDFRPLLSTLFLLAIEAMFTGHVEAAVKTFRSQMTLFKGRFPSKFYPTTSSLPSPTPPPTALLRHSALATLTNGLIAGFNELRVCAPMALYEPLARVLSNGVDTVVDVLQTATSQLDARPDLSVNLRAQLNDMIVLVAQQGLPFWCSLFNDIFGVVGVKRRIDAARYVGMEGCLSGADWSPSFLPLLRSLCSEPSLLPALSVPADTRPATLSPPDPQPVPHPALPASTDSTAIDT